MTKQAGPLAAMRTAITRNRISQHLPLNSPPLKLKHLLTQLPLSNAISLGQCGLTKTARFLGLATHPFQVGCRHIPCLVLQCALRGVPSARVPWSGRQKGSEVSKTLPFPRQWTLQKKSILIWSLIWRISRISKYCQPNTNSDKSRPSFTLRN